MDRTTADRSGGLVLPRRKFLAGLAGIIAAPAIVRAASLMPVRAYDEMEFSGFFSRIPVDQMPDMALYQQLMEITRRAFVPRIWLSIQETSPLAELIQRRA